jgi:hypothetical protein
MKANRPISLSGTQALYIALVLLVVLPTVVALAFQPVLENLWCQQLEIPRYEAALGFKLGRIPIVDQTGSARQSVGIAWVDPSGPMGRSGIRAGDFPRMQHGFQDFCAQLAWVTEGQAVEIEVVNVADLGKGNAGRRIVTVRGSTP